MSSVYIPQEEEEELTRDKRGKERTIHVKKRRKDHLSFFLSSSSSVYSRNDCMLYRLRIELIRVILYCSILARD